MVSEHLGFRSTITQSMTMFFWELPSKRFGKVSSFLRPCQEHVAWFGWFAKPFRESWRWFGGEALRPNHPTPTHPKWSRLECDCAWACDPPVHDSLTSSRMDSGSIFHYQMMPALGYTKAWCSGRLGITHGTCTFIAIIWSPDFNNSVNQKHMWICTPVLLSLQKQEGSMKHLIVWRSVTACFPTELFPQWNINRLPLDCHQFGITWPLSGNYMVAK